MAEFTVIRRKTYSAKLQAESAWEAERLAEELPGKDWEMTEDRITGVIGVDGAMQHTLKES